MSVDDGITGIWAVIVPTGKLDTNYVQNPSFEVDTAGWTATGTASATRVSTGAGGFGLYSVVFVASAQNGRYEYSAPQFAGGTLVVASAWVKTTSPLVVLRLAYGGVTVDQAHPGDGAWHRLSVATTAVAATTPIIGIRDGRASAWDGVYVDGVQFETGISAATTYLDGDQDGCSWVGTAHGSTSTRNGRDGRGGQIVSFDNLGLYVVAQQGLGMPPITVGTQALALGDGSIYSRSIGGTRVLTLSTEMIYPTGLIGELHTIRAAVISAFNLDTRNGRGPITLRYRGAAAIKFLAAYYDSGLEQQKTEPTTEIAPVRFLAPDPYFYGETESQASLSTSQSVSGVSGLALRDPTGTWSNLGGGFTALSTSYIWSALRLFNGTVVVSGNFANMGGVAAADNLAVWNGLAWAALGGVTPNDVVYGLALGNAGELYVGGAFTDLAGIANADRVAVWDGATWAALSTGANFMVRALAFQPSSGYLFAVGDFTIIGGVAANFAAYWTGAAWVSAASGFPTTYTTTPTLAIGPDGFVYCSVREGVYRWSGSTWTLIGQASSNDSVFRIRTVGRYLYAVGAFTSIGGVAANKIARYNGIAWQPLGSGVSAGTINSVSAGLLPGEVYAAGGNWGTIGEITPPDSLAAWNGWTWLPIPVNPPNTAAHANDIYTLHPLGDGSLIVSWTAAVGTFGTSLTAEGITTVNNSGSANAYPAIVFNATGSVYALHNFTTGQTILFSGAFVWAGDPATLDLRRGHGLSTFKTASGRDLISTILPASDLVAFCLAPGANRIALFSDGGTAAIRFQPRYWSAD